MTREVRGFNQIFSVFSKFNKNQIFFGQFVVVVIFSIHKPTLGSCEVQHKSLARMVQPFGRLLDTTGHTNKQTNTHPPKVYIYQAFRALPAHILFQLNIFLFVNMVKQKQNQKRSRISLKNRQFSKFYENRILLEASLNILTIHKSSLGSRKVPHKI